MAFSYLTGAVAGALNTATIAAIDASNATLLVAAANINVFNATDLTAISDSEGNVWLLVDFETSTANQTLLVWVCVNPTVSATFTVSVSYGNGNSAIGLAVMAFSGSTAKPVQTVDAESSGTSAQPGSLTPPSDNCLIINAAALYIATGISISEGTAITKGFAGGFNLAIALAYSIQTTATASNPTWSWTSSGESALRQIVFMEVAAAGGAVDPLGSLAL